MGRFRGVRELLFVVSMAAVASACGTKANPAATCADGTCSDPVFPFCDVDGAVGGTANACIAVTCTVGEVAECRGSAALTCSVGGTSFDEIPCDHGCAPTVGCKACDAGQTVCANGAVSVCDGSGNVASTACALGCFMDQPRCTDIDPSNGLAMYLDMVTNPPDVHIDSTGTVNSDTGELVLTPSQATLMIPSFIAPPSNGGPAIRVYVVRDLVDDTLYLAGSLPVAILASGDITINAPIDSHAGNSVACAGGPGHDAGENPDFSAASGGGGNATSGGAGGGITGDATIAGGAGGAIAGTSDLQPLVGGCDAGSILVFADSSLHYPGSPGGGGLQLSSRTRITVNARIDASGGAGYVTGDQITADTSSLVVSGGGAGGNVLLEAPLIDLNAGANLDARGGSGGQNGAVGFNVGEAGRGSTTATANGIAGGSVVANGNPNISYFGGAGGGGIGRIRINVPNAAVSMQHLPTLVGALSVATLRTR